MVPVTTVPAGAVPKTTTLLPSAACITAPVTAPLVTLSGDAAATSPAVADKSNTVSHWRVAAAGPVGRISLRHTLFHTAGSAAIWSVIVTAAFAGSTVVMVPAKAPLVTSKRRTLGSRVLTLTGGAGKWN